MVSRTIEDSFVAQNAEREEQPMSIKTLADLASDWHKRCEAKERELKAKPKIEDDPEWGSW